MTDAPGTLAPPPASPGSGALLEAIVAKHRRLLARLRDVMAGSDTGQLRLDAIVALIAEELAADVCSCYVLRAGEVLELFSTIGLKAEAVHKTRLRVGEGLVGDVAAYARTLAVADAPNHPNFVYRPETGEDPFHSLLGVPLLRDGRVRGVLVIQHKERHPYPDDEIEILETVAMVVAELVTSGALLGSQERPLVDVEQLLPSRLNGVVLNRGLGYGLAVLHRHQLVVTRMVADDPASELVRLDQALSEMLRAIDDLVAVSTLAPGNDPRDILETYRLIAQDRGWVNRIREAIGAGLTAEAAVSRVQNDTRARMIHVADPYLRERLLDLDDLAYRLLRHLSGMATPTGGPDLPEEFILVARTLGPADLLEYDQRRLRGLVLEEGSTTSHVAIIARALGLPVIGQCSGALSRIESLDPIIVDGELGQVFVRPNDHIRTMVIESVSLAKQRERLHAELAGLPAVSRDGMGVALQVNCGLLIDLPHLDESGASGIGLYRTEIPFMVQSTYPDVDSQTRLYAKIIDHCGNRPVTFRTLDVGGDKRLHYFFTEEEENPALGWRAIRIGLDRPLMLRHQLRAMLRAANGRPLRVMFPMIAEVTEFERARAILELECSRLPKSGWKVPSELKVGAMVEVPALLWQLPALLQRVDFVSVGSNDLAQFMFACDRGHPRIGNRYDTLSPALLRALATLVEHCDAAGVPVSLCGEMAGRPLDAMALIGIGFRSLSMSPPAIGPVKVMLRSLDVGLTSGFIRSLLGNHDHSLRLRLEAFAKDHGIMI